MRRRSVSGAGDCCCDRLLDDRLHFPEFAKKALARVRVTMNDEPDQIVRLIAHRSPRYFTSTQPYILNSAKCGVITQITRYLPGSVNVNATLCGGPNAGAGSMKTRPMGSSM